MSSHVVVIDSSFRRVQIKVNPGTYLTEVIEQAREKLKLGSSNYGLKNNNKVLDMSRTFRQSGLVSGAKLELVVTSRSPSAVSVALDLPESLAASNKRLTDTFPSDTTLWLILRKFESYEGRNLNITGRGVAQVQNGASGAGRIVYEMPVLNIVGRELSTFGDLQKTLAQVGLNSGRGLIKLRFTATDQPLEEAMAQIGQYFKEDEPDDKATGTSKEVEVEAITEGISRLDSNEKLASQSEDTELTTSDDTSTGPSPYPETVGDAPLPNSHIPSKRPATSPGPDTQERVLGPDGRPISVYRAPSNHTPQAALAPHNDADYEPTVAHAKLHQTRLQNNSQNKRLLSDAEAERQEKERAEQLAKAKEVKIKFRFPDQSSVEAMFGTEVTSSDLYRYAAGLIEAEGEPFKLSYFKDKGSATIPDNDSKLIKDLGFRGSVLVTFLWGDDARESIRKLPTLKPQYREKAKDVPVPKVPGVEEQDEKNASDNKGKGKDDEKPNKKGGGGESNFKNKFLRFGKK